jgi:sigma-E factor negative regulatory protein RseA
MDKISQLMDGELDEHESRLQIARLEQNAGLVQTWATYHLIRDVLRDDAHAADGLAHRVCQRLEQEPTVVAPHTRLGARVVRHSLPMAAVAAGVAVVVWLALGSSPDQRTAGSPIVQNTRPPPPGIKEVKRAVPPVSERANRQMNEYLLAHQEFSPTTAMQGWASYVRTVSNEDPDSPR